MPAKVALDSLWFQPLAGFGSKDNFVIIPQRQDPPGVPNYYRFQLIKNDTLQKNILIQNDQFTDGRKVTQPLGQGRNTVKRGDTITLIQYSIDEKVYKYFFALNQNSGGPNSAASPANPTNNFDKPCLGYFSAQTQDSRTAIVP